MAIDKRLPIYRFVVGEDDEAGVTAVALVDHPAIEMNWQAFNSQFVVEPESNESQDEFISRCIAVEIGNGYEQEQAAAICYSKWDKKGFAEGMPHYTAGGKLWKGPTHKDANGRLMTGATHTKDSEYLYHKDDLQNFESYTDYPEAAKKNAQAALNYAEKNGWGDCGTDVGKQRANQLAKGEAISRDTIARMAAFERHRQNSNKKLGDGCGRLMWLAWGGDEGVEWAQRKLEQIDSKKFKFSANKEKRIISGALMVADLPIYRKDEQGEYYGLFTAEDIYNIRNKFFKNNNTKSVNEMHDPNKMIDGVYMIESFIIDSKRGINAPDGLKLTDGSWFGSYKVDNEEIWNDFIKTGEFKGFSVEGVFKTTQIDSKPLSIIEQAIDIIKQIED